MPYRLSSGGLSSIFLALVDSEHILPLPGCFFGLGNADLEERGLEKKKKFYEKWLGKEFYITWKRKF